MKDAVGLDTNEGRGENSTTAQDPELTRCSSFVAFTESGLTFSAAVNPRQNKST
jgi:hypothetical protein